MTRLSVNIDDGEQPRRGTELGTARVTVSCPGPWEAASRAQSSGCHFLHVHLPGLRTTPAIGLEMGTVLSKKCRTSSGRCFSSSGEWGNVPRQEFFSFLEVGLSGSRLGSLKPCPQPFGLRMLGRGQAAPPTPPSSFRSASCSPEMNGGGCSG